MHKAVVLFLLSLAIGSAQVGPGPIVIADGWFPPQLKTYLELTDAQVTAITKASTDLNTLRSAKLQRQIQIQGELAQESAKETVDPMALGLRHAELEVIRRELATEQQKTAAAVQNLLTAPQKAKLAVLQQSLQLYSLACLAVGHNVLDDVPSLPGNIIPANRIVREPYPAAFLFGRALTPSCGGTTGVIFNAIPANSDGLASR